MRFKDVFSIIGPAMIGPSSSHTAGAVRLGRTARQIHGTLPQAADILFYGSFAQTYRGHGTDVAIAAGILDFHTDDPRIPDALKLAQSLGVSIAFRTGSRTDLHPNAARIVLKGERGEDRIVGTSIGGGNIEIVEVNDFDVRFSARLPTLLIYHEDRSGMIAQIAGLVKDGGLNIGFMDVDRKTRSGEALTVIATDEPISRSIALRIRDLPNVRQVRLVDLADKKA